MFRFYIAILLLIYLSPNAQVPFRKDVDIQDPHELNAGINFNTLGNLLGGVTIKYNKQINPTKINSFTFEMVNIKDPKEFLQQASNTNSSYTHGKNNYLLSLRTLYGKNFILFNKAKDEGIEFAINTSGGLALGFEKPYYVLLKAANFDDSTGYFPYKDVKDPNKIAGHGNIFMGMGSSKIVPGASLRLSSILEFGFSRENTIGIEVGTQLDAYSRKIEILNYTQPKSLFFSAFIVGYIGIRW